MADEALYFLRNTRPLVPGASSTSNPWSRNQLTASSKLLTLTFFAIRSAFSRLWLSLGAESNYPPSHRIDYSIRTKLARDATSSTGSQHATSFVSSQHSVLESTTVAHCKAKQQASEMFMNRTSAIPATGL